MSTLYENMNTINDYLIEVSNDDDDIDYDVEMRHHKEMMDRNDKYHKLNVAKTIGSGVVAGAAVGGAVALSKKIEKLTKELDEEESKEDKDDEKIKKLKKDIKRAKLEKKLCGYATVGGTLAAANYNYNGKANIRSKDHHEREYKKNEYLKKIFSDDKDIKESLLIENMNYIDEYLTEAVEWKRKINQALRKYKYNANDSTIEVGGTVYSVNLNREGKTHYNHGNNTIYLDVNFLRNNPNDIDFIINHEVGHNAIMNKQDYTKSSSKFAIKDALKSKFYGAQKNVGYEEAKDKNYEKNLIKKSKNGEKLSTDEKRDLARLQMSKTGDDVDKKHRNLGGFGFNKSSHLSQIEHDADTFAADKVGDEKAFHALNNLYGKSARHAAMNEISEMLSSKSDKDKKEIDKIKDQLNHLPKKKNKDGSINPAYIAAKEDIASKLKLNTDAFKKYSNINTDNMSPQLKASIDIMRKGDIEDKKAEIKDRMARKKKMKEAKIRVDKFAADAQANDGNPRAEYIKKVRENGINTKAVTSINDNKNDGIRSTSKPNNNLKKVNAKNPGAKQKSFWDNDGDDFDLNKFKK